MSASTARPSELHLYDQRRILEGFLYPEMGWTVDFIPGLSSMPEVTYHCQEVPLPLNAWTSVEITDEDLLFGHGCKARGFRVHSGDATTTSLTSGRMHHLHCRGSRIIEMPTLAHHLKHRKKKAVDRIEYGYDSDAAQPTRSLT